jgi:hypothetical protein
MAMIELSMERSGLLSFPSFADHSTIFHLDHPSLQRYFIAVVPTCEIMLNITQMAIEIIILFRRRHILVFYLHKDGHHAYFTSALSFAYIIIRTPDSIRREAIGLFLLGKDSSTARHPRTHVYPAEVIARGGEIDRLSLGTIDDLPPISPAFVSVLINCPDDSRAKCDPDTPHTRVRLEL